MYRGINGFVLLALLLMTTTAALATDSAAPAARRTLVLDGSAVHDLGSTALNITNWGLIGARPGTTFLPEGTPSLEYPVGSGVNHLYAAGLWVGARVGGEARVTTGQFTPEILPDPDDPLDVVYEAPNSAAHSKRYPMRAVDDDRDGLEDEDPLDGRDNDGDGRIDEDYAVIGDQYFRAVGRDDGQLVTDLFPDHHPLGIEVVQESFQWRNHRIDDGVGFRFTITNRGDQLLEDVVLGMFSDFDIGSSEGSSEDDLPGLYRGMAVADDGAAVDLTLAYMFDADHSEGAFAGVVLASPGMPATGFQLFSGQAPFDRGGDPTNDAERYEALAEQGYDAVPDPQDLGRANDYRVLLATGPIASLEPGRSVALDLAFVVGATREELVQNAANLVHLASGQLFDRDGDPSTGEDGREFHVSWIWPSDRGLRPAGHGLHLSVRPNPSNPRLQVQFDLPVRGATRIDAYDVRGRYVKTVLDRVMSAGPGEVVWDATDTRGRAVGSGVYFLRATQGTVSDAMRVVVVR